MLPAFAERYCCVDHKTHSVSYRGLSTGLTEVKPIHVTMLRRNDIACLYNIQNTSLDQRGGKEDSLLIGNLFKFSD